MNYSCYELKSLRLKVGTNKSGYKLKLVQIKLVTNFKHHKLVFEANFSKE